mmetsp:Transcript_46894/g.106178  ORF Transcript_46894/g.106178 Transcript_46894/m.106178 type:complete len:224 (-) Transcript_46894:646-1317(-)
MRQSRTKRTKWMSAIFTSQTLRPWRWTKGETPCPSGKVSNGPSSHPWMKHRPPALTTSSFETKTSWPVHSSRWPWTARGRPFPCRPWPARSPASAPRLTPPLGITPTSRASSPIPRSTGCSSTTPPLHNAGFLPTTKLPPSPRRPQRPPRRRVRCRGPRWPRARARGTSSRCAPSRRPTSGPPWTRSSAPAARTSADLGAPPCAGPPPSPGRRNPPPCRRGRS